MPLHLGKIAALIALLTIAAFVLWLLFGSLWQGEQAEKRANIMPNSAPASPLALQSAGPEGRLDHS